MQSPVAFQGRRWLELALDYRCNLRCLGCHACHDTGERLSSGQALGFMRRAREAGVTQLWLGGGEPTLREDLLSVVREARKMGFTEVTLQTNGMRLAYAAYRDAVLLAGVTEVRLNVKSHRGEVHDRLSGGEDAHARLLEALAGLAGKGVRIAADVLLTRSAAGDLPEIVPFYAARGVGSFCLWLLSAADSTEASVASEVPRIADLVPALTLAQAAARAAGVPLTSLHTPPCTLPSELRSIFTPARDLSLLVVGPDGRPFALETSSFEGGAFLDGCARCSERDRCGGPRADYVRIHGATELTPLVG